MPQKFAIPAFFGNPSDPTNPNAGDYARIVAPSTPAGSIIVLDLSFQDPPMTSIPVQTPAGMQTVTPLSMAGIHLGSVLSVGTAANKETVTVLAVSPVAAPSALTANFVQPHPVNCLVRNLVFFPNDFPSSTDVNLVAPFNAVAANYEIQGFIVFGYVDTDLGTGAPCPSAAPPSPDCYGFPNNVVQPFPNEDRTEARIKAYVDFLYQAIQNLDGIFFDQGPAPYCFTGGSTAPGSAVPIDPCLKTLYSDLYQYVKSKPVRPGRPAVGGNNGGAVLLNASQYQEASVADPSSGGWIMTGVNRACDVAILWETSACNYFLTESSSPGAPAQTWPAPPPAWWLPPSLGPDRISHTIFSCPSSEDMRRAMALSDSRLSSILAAGAPQSQAGYVFVTDTENATYNRLPRYWSDELNAISGPGSSPDVRRAASPPAVQAASSRLCVRDWTDTPTIYDSGLQPSVGHDFWTTPDVWNRNGNTSGADSANRFPLSNDQPANENPLISGGGSPQPLNYAFARVHRAYPCHPDTTETGTVTFLWADFGTGSNFQYVVPGSRPASTASFTLNRQGMSPQDETSAIAGPVQWVLPATVGAHICLAVEVSSPADSLSAELNGMAAGSAIGAIVTNEPKIAQRNLRAVAVPGGTKPLPFSFCALAHNADLFPRTMVLSPRLPEPIGRGMLEAASVTIIDGSGKQIAAALTPGKAILLEEMQPGENRAICLGAQVRGGVEGETLPLIFEDVVDGRTVSGFTVAIRVSPLKTVIRDNLNLHVIECRRLDTALKATENLTEPALRAYAGRPPTDKEYLHFVRSHLEPMWRSVDALELRGTKDPFDLESAYQRLANATAAADVQLAAACHSQLLHRLDMVLTMRQKAEGDVGDILQMVRWQKELYTAVARLVDVDGSRRLVAGSDELIEAYRSGKIQRDAYSRLLLGQLEVFKRTAKAVKEGLGLTEDVDNIEQQLGSPAGLQKAHREYLIKLQRLYRRGRRRLSSSGRG